MAIFRNGNAERSMSTMKTATQYDSQHDFETVKNDWGHWACDIPLQAASSSMSQLLPRLVGAEYCPNRVVR